MFFFFNFIFKINNSAVVRSFCCLKMTQSHLTKKINEGRHPADFKRQFPSHFCFFFSSHKWLCRGERDEWDAWLYRRPRRRESPHPPRIIAKYHEACSISDHPEIKRPYSFIKFFFLQSTSPICRQKILRNSWRLTSR